ncbi:MAG: WhiB family transcriptional regulator [Pseudonocardia sp.]|jgi:WhiB family transcriptional regulator, redox-sensing transcriptional regulator
MHSNTTRVSGDWRVSANCQHDEPDALFVRGRHQRAARAICQGCPVLTECLSHALDNRIEFGVWGGVTERARRALLRRRPDVTDWSAFLGANPMIDPAADPARAARRAA